MQLLERLTGRLGARLGHVGDERLGEARGPLEPARPREKLRPAQSLPVRAEYTGELLFCDDRSATHRSAAPSVGSLRRMDSYTLSQCPEISASARAVISACGVH